MDPPVSLYNVAGLSSERFSALLDEIRSSSYIDEIVSGEEPREESPLYNEITLVDDDALAQKKPSIDELYEHAGKPRVLAFVDDKDAKAVTIVETKQDGQRETLRVAPKDVIEVCCNCRIANMDLLEFKSIAQKSGSEVYDSQRS